jgi:glucose-1-phosphate cytidylyltransferase
MSPVRSGGIVPVVILCGGRGLRMSGHEEALPKPLVEIGGRPILWHVMSLYAAQGFRSFVLCLGHEGARIRETISALPELVSGEEHDDGWNVAFADTGIDTPTGGRVARVGRLVDDGTFFLTYADGVADIDLGQLLAYHGSHERAATLTVVRPRNPWGFVDRDGDGQVAGFR